MSVDIGRPATLKLVLPLKKCQQLPDLGSALLPQQTMVRHEVARILGVDHSFPLWRSARHSSIPAISASDHLPPELALGFALVKPTAAML